MNVSRQTTDNIGSAFKQITGTSFSIQVQYAERQSFSAWKELHPPERILLVRLHAIGDVAITFPALHSLKSWLPAAQIDYLVCPDASLLPAALTFIDNLHVMPYAAKVPMRILNGMSWGLKLRTMKYDVVIDLQRNSMTRMLRHIIAPRAFGEFDRFTSKSAGERVLETFYKAGLSHVVANYSMRIKEDLKERALGILAQNGWDGREKLIILNPAGLWETRHWPTDYYISLGKKLVERYRSKILFLGTARMIDRVSYIEKQLGNPVINLVDRTGLDEAFAILQHASLMVSEDSGLMHMAWVSGIPTIALFGSSRHKWSAPMGVHSFFLHSGDLDCGACMQPTCKYGDVHCLTRYSADHVFGLVEKMLK